jgi:hypothetical protein
MFFAVLMDKRYAFNHLCGLTLIKDYIVFLYCDL